MGVLEGVCAVEFSEALGACSDIFKRDPWRLKWYTPVVSMDGGGTTVVAGDCDSALL
jgi:hypothetical protein